MTGGAEGQGIGLGTILAGLALATFVTYVCYKISKNRAEIRETIELLDAPHAAFVNDLESLVENGVIASAV